MQIQKLLEGKRDRAVSPVIGVILMVAITVILAAVIGTFVIGMGDNIQTSVQAGASVQDNGNDRLTTTYTSAQDSETYLNVSYEADVDGAFDSVSDSEDTDGVTSHTSEINEIGGTDTLRLVSGNGEVEIVVSVTAINGDTRTSILTKTVTVDTGEPATAA